MSISQRLIPSIQSFGLFVFVALAMLAMPTAIIADDAAAELTKETKSSPATVFTTNRSAIEVAKTLGSQMHGRRDVSIIPDVHSNVLIVRGDKKAVEEVQGYLKVLDTPFQTVTYKVTIAVTAEDTESQILDELELSTLDNNKAKMQFGQQVAVPTGATRVSASRSIRSYSQVSAGTIVQVQPRVSNGKILTDIMLEKSWVETPVSESEDDAASQHTTFNLSFDSTLALQEGVEQTIRAKATSSPGSQRSVLITVLATITPAGKSKVASRDSNPKAQNTLTRPMPSARFTEGRGAIGRPSGPPISRSPGRRPSQGTSASVSHLFSRIDKDNDGVISKKEWTTQSISSVFTERGFQFTEGMNQEGFEEAMSEMVKTFRKRSSLNKEASSRNSSPQNDRGRDPAKPRKGDRDEKPSDSRERKVNGK